MWSGKKMQQMNINRKGPQTDIPQNVGSKEGLSAKIYQLDTLNISKCILKFEIPSQKFLLHWKCRGGSRIFFRRGCRWIVSCSTSTPINHIVFFFCRIPVVLENWKSSRGGVRTPCTLPLDPPLKWHCQRFVARTKKVAKNEMSQGYYTG